MKKSDSSSGDQEKDRDAETRRRLRLLVLLHCAENAGLIPLHILQLHTFAYLANVLAPVWCIPTQEGKLLKLRGGPFYPVLQRDLDCLVGAGVVLMSGVGYSLDESKRWRLDGSYRLNHDSADRILGAARQFDDENKTEQFIQELAYALSALSDQELSLVPTEDATYSDPLVDVGNVVDFGEWRSLNFSANAASSFERLLPSSAQATLGEKLHFYVRHLRVRLHGGR